MKCQTLFSGKNKKNIINLSSAENAQRVVKVNPLNACHSIVDDKFVIFFFQRNRAVLSLKSNKKKYI